MRAYSLDLRRKVVEAVIRGMPKAAAARNFGIGISTVKRYMGKVHKGEDLAPSRPPGKRRTLDEGAMRLLKSDLKERPALTLAHRRTFLERVVGAQVSESTIPERSRGLDGAEKRSVGAQERDEFLRAAWRVMVAARTKANRFVFVDECSTNTTLAPLYAWSPKGQRARCKVPRNHGPNVTLLASMTHEGIGPCLRVEGATTREVFETYIEQMLGPALRPGQIVIMDNLSSHKCERARELIEERGCGLSTCRPTRR